MKRYREFIPNKTAAHTTSPVQTPPPSRTLSLAMSLALSLVLSLALVVTASLPSACLAYSESGATGDEITNQISGAEVANQVSADEVLTEGDVCGDETDLLMMYMEQQITGAAQDDYGSEAAGDSDGSEAAGGAAVASSDRGARLKGNDKKIYTALASAISKIAAGKRESSIIEIPLRKVTGKLKFTAADLGVSSILDKNGNVRSSAKKALQNKYAFDLRTIHSALLADMPYELYWYDKAYTRYDSTGKAVQMACSYTISDSSGMLLYSYNDKYMRFTNDPVIRFKFVVSGDYSWKGSTGTYDLRSDLAAVRAAVSNAKAIAASHAGETDLEKLDSYREEICDLASYDFVLGADLKSRDYGDPWQIIYVFDGDSSTKVVCEGYAKAFQFLCDISSFNSSRIKCRIVSGTLDMDDDSPHMWNILRMNDGSNHIADITNCDAGTVGYPDKVFLKKYTARQSNKYYRYAVSGGSIIYGYNSSTTEIYGSSELAMSDADYSCPHNDEDWDDGIVTASESGQIEQTESDAVRTQGAVLTYTCRVCGETTSAGYASLEEAEQARYERLAERYTPSGVSLSSLTAGSKKVTVKWKRLSSYVTRYEIELKDTSTGKTKTVKAAQASGSTIGKTVSGLKKNRKYKVRVRAYKSASGYVFYGKWSKTKSVRVR